MGPTRTRDLAVGALAAAVIASVFIRLLYRHFPPVPVWTGVSLLAVAVVEAGWGAPVRSRIREGRIGVGAGDPVLVRSETGELRARTHVARIRAGNAQMFFPECNALIRAGERDASGVPDYNAIVEVVPAP